VDNLSPLQNFAEGVELGIERVRFGYFCARIKLDNLTAYFTDMNKKEHAPEVKKESIYEKRASELARMLERLGYESKRYIPVNATNDPERKDFIIKFNVNGHSVEIQCEGPELRLYEVLNRGQSLERIGVEGNPTIDMMNEEMLKKIFETKFGEKYI